MKKQNDEFLVMIGGSPYGGGQCFKADDQTPFTDVMKVIRYEAKAGAEWSDRIRIRVYRIVDGRVATPPVIRTSVPTIKYLSDGVWE